MKRIIWRWIIAVAFGLVPLVAEAGTIVYYHNDLLGSPAVATDSSGNVIWRESYRPYGERLTNDPASSANDVWFTGRRQDAASGLVYMGARYYDPVVGRFLSVDPGPVEPLVPGTFNRYAYANNNPYRYYDRDGKGFALAEILIVTTGVVLAGEIWWNSQPDRRQEQQKLARRLGSIFHNESNEPTTATPTTAGTGDTDSQADVTKRPSRVRKGTEQANWDNAEDGPAGGKLCPTCQQEVQSRPGEKGKDWDNDHVTPWRDRDLSGKDRKGVLDEYNRDTRLRCVGCNRSDNGAGGGSAGW